MGYCATQTGCSFFIAKADKLRGLELLQASFEFEGELESLKDAFEDSKWTLNFKDGDIVGVSWWGDKYRDDDNELLEAIAPVVKDGSYIELCGEDGDSWRLVFKNGEMKEIRPKVIWEDH
jgi:hypothetical protein